MRVGSCAHSGGSAISQLSEYNTAEYRNDKWPNIGFNLTIHVWTDIISISGVRNVKRYRKRIVDEELQERLEGKGAVLIEGPKWCGKTTTAEQIILCK